MDKEEFELWRMFDIAGYAGAIDAIIQNVQNIGEHWKSGPCRFETETLDEKIGYLEGICNSLAVRIEEIDESQYDERFPTNILDSLKKRVAPALRTTPQKVREAIQKETDYSKVKAYVEEETSHMAKLCRELMEHPGYRKFRNKASQEERIGYR